MDTKLSFALHMCDENNLDADIQEHRKCIQSIIDSSPTGIALWDIKGNILYANPQMLKLLILDNQEDFTNLIEFSSPLQPCGTTSEKKAIEYINTALEKGTYVFNWMHKTSTGYPYTTDLLHRIDVQMYNYKRISQQSYALPDFQASSELLSDHTEL